MVPYIYILKKLSHTHLQPSPFGTPGSPHPAAAPADDPGTARRSAADRCRPRSGDSESSRAPPGQRTWAEKPDVNGKERSWYPLVNIQKAIENGHLFRGFSH